MDILRIIQSFLCKKYFSNINSHYFNRDFFFLFIDFVVFNFILTKQLYKLQLIKFIYQRVAAFN